MDHYICLNLKIVKEAIWNVSSLSIPSNWWTGFSTWQYFFGLLRTGTKLPIHSVVLEGNRSLERIESGICNIDHVSENGDIFIYLHEDFSTLMKGYQITAKRKRLWPLKQIASYNVAKCISIESVSKLTHTTIIVQLSLNVLWYIFRILYVCLKNKIIKYILVTLRPCSASRNFFVTWKVMQKLKIIGKPLLGE